MFLQIMRIEDREIIGHVQTSVLGTDIIVPLPEPYSVTMRLPVAVWWTDENERPLVRAGGERMTKRCEFFIEFSERVYKEMMVNNMHIATISVAKPSC